MTRPRDDTWICPLPIFDGHVPTLLEKDATTTRVSVGYLDGCPSGIRIPVFAAQRGLVTFAGRLNDDTIVRIAHSRGWASEYSGLSLLLAASTGSRKARIRAGEVVGYVSGTAPRVSFQLAQRAHSASGGSESSELMRDWTSLRWSLFDVAATSAAKDGRDATR